MLLHFTVSNFRSFRGVQTLNLMASSDKTLPGNVISPDLPGLKNKKWVKGAAIYGANASGKSTLLDALSTLAELVKVSAKTTDPKSRIKLIEPFSLDVDAAEEPTAFGIVFVNQGERYEYRVAATQERIFHESLRSFPTGAERLWFVRDWSAETKEYTFSPESPAGLARHRDIEKRTLPNMLYLSKGVAENRTELEPVFRWFVENLHMMDLSAKSDLGTNYTMQQLHGKSAAKSSSILNILKHADLGITGAKVIEEAPSSEELEHLRELLPKKEFDDLSTAKRIKPELMHRSDDDQSLPLPWDRESMGTHRLFALSGPWLDILENGYTVCIDELETSMHPHVVMELLKIFFSEEHNPNHAQIIFTTHNPLLLDTSAMMRRDQIWFTDKDNEGRSHLYPLTDYSPRKGESLVRGYMAGRYGGVPFIPNGLLSPEVKAQEPVTSNSSADE